MGATATGKSSLAISLALAFDGEVVSMDSRQSYRSLDIGTGKVSAAERAGVPHHLLDILGPTETGNAGSHASMAESAIRDIAARGRVAFLAGGTGLYFRALFGGLVPVTIPRADLARIRATFAGRPTGELYDELKRRDAARADELSPNDRIRITRALELIEYSGRPVSELYAHPAGPAADIAYLKLALTMPRERLRERIAERTRSLFTAGWGDEVRALLGAGVSVDAPAMRSLGYEEIAGAILGGEDPASCLDRVITLTRQYAKRQETFFRSESAAIWLDVYAGDAAERASALVTQFLRSNGPQ